MTTERRLIFIRHAHSPHASGANGDHERPLSDRGRLDAEHVARRLRELEWYPEAALSSDAVRARQTWEVMEPIFDIPDLETRDTRDLYRAEVEDICNHIWSLSADVENVAIIGHNPGWEHTVEWLTQTRVTMPTGSAALLEGQGESWPEATQRSEWHFVQLIRPSALRMESDHE